MDITISATTTKQDATYSVLQHTRDDFDINQLLPMKMFRILITYFLPLIILCGLIGNTLSAVVMTRGTFAGSTTSIYFVALAGNDIKCR